MAAIIKCELCFQAAVVYCPADKAFLCSGCDDSVHGANFIFARHVRLPLCADPLPARKKRHSCGQQLQGSVKRHRSGSPVSVFPEVGTDEPDEDGSSDITSDDYYADESDAGSVVSRHRTCHKKK